MIMPVSTRHAPGRGESELGLWARDGTGQARFAFAAIKRCVARPVEEIEMADVGNRITVASKGGPRPGVVTAVNGAMITVRWDSGGETSILPGPGVLSLVTSQRRTPSARTRPTISGATAASRKTSAANSPSAVVRKAAPGKKAIAVKTPVVKKLADGKTPVVKKVAGAKKTR